MKKIFILLFVLVSFLNISFAQEKSKSDGIYGICEHTTFTYDYSEHEKMYPLMQNIGVSMVRSDIVWAWNWNQHTGEIIFDHLDKVAKKMDDANIGFLPILNGVPENAMPLHLDNNLKKWNSAVASFVKRYKYRCPYWEIWNEQNMPNNAWAIGDNWGDEMEVVRAKNYTTVLKSTYNTIKGIDPNLKILYGGTSGIPINFIEITLKEGAGQFFDIMNVHPYDWQSNPEDYLRESIWDLKSLMAKYNLRDKPIWVTEIGWPTAKQPDLLFYKQVLPIAFSKLNIKPETVPIVFIDDVLSNVNDLARDFPKFKEVITIPIEKMKDLDPAKYPILVPTKKEKFKMHYANDLIEYVKKGGTIILPESIPFYYDIPVYDNIGNAKPIPNFNIFEALHFKFEAWNLRTDKIEIPGVNTSEIKHHPNERFLVDGNLKSGDTFIPLAYGVKDSKKAVIAALINLNSDLKGNIIVCTRTDADNGAQVTISEETEAQIIQRAHLIMFAEGIQKVFWYKFMAANNGDTNISDLEESFGIVRKNLTPKPAYKAYKVLTEMYPDGSSIPIVTKNEEGIYTGEWKRPDNKKIYAVWAGYGKKNFNTSFIKGNILNIVDYMGNVVNKSAQYNASPGITFFICSEEAQNTIEPKEDLSVGVYPNPNFGKFTLKLPKFNKGQFADIQIYNSIGTLMISEKQITETLKFDLSAYPKGYYYVKIIRDGKTVTKRILCN